jgi:two-component system, chemotaxis family, chemotaxis protein CheY
MWNANVSDEKLVLVVDDDSSVRESIAEMLEAKGYAVLQAENGQKALDVLKSTQHFPCLVILDLAMPIMDGRGFLKQRAEDSILRDIPVVIVSGNAQSDEPLEGICAYLRKPVNVDRLIDLIDHHC